MKQNQDSEILQKKSWELFAVAREESIEAPPYLKTRVLQELQSRQRQHSRILLWRRMSIASMLLIGVIVGWLLRSGQEEAAFIAAVGRPMAVRIELAAAAVDSVEIELPEGVVFYSEKLGSLAQEKILTLQLGPDYAGGKLPIVVKSNEEGLKMIKVRMLDGKQGLIGERWLRIEFKGDDLS